MWHRLKGIGVVAVVASLATLAGAGSASATLLEVAGTTKNEAVTITASLKAKHSLVLSRTEGSLVNTCALSAITGDTETFAGTTVTGAIDLLSFSKCERTVTVHKAGTLHIEHIAGSTNGTVSSSGAEVTVGSPFGTLNCKTSAGVDLGTLTGNSSGNAVMDINAVLNCGFLVPSASWKGTYEVTSPSGLGVSATPTRLEVGGVETNEPVELTASLEPGTSPLIKGEAEYPEHEETVEFANTCTEAHIKAATVKPFSGTEVAGPVSDMSFGGCNSQQVTVHKRGELYIEYTSGTNGNVISAGAEVTVNSPLGVLRCTTNEGVTIGALTGKASGSATLDLNGVINCGFLLPSATLKGSYVITSPSGLGVNGPPTALEIGGVTQTESISITASLEPGTSVSLGTTTGELASTCIASHMQGATVSPFTGTRVKGSLSDLSFSGCSGYPKADKTGTLSIKWSSGTNGTVSSSAAEVTVGTPYGAINCKTGAATDIGTLTGKKEGYATLDVNAPLDCGPSVSNARWEASYVVTSPEGLGVTNVVSPPSTTLEVNGVKQNSSVNIEASLASGSSALLSRTDGSLANTCTTSTVAGDTETFTGTTVTGAVDSLSFSNCERTVTVHKAGTLHVGHIEGTTDGTVSSSGAEVTVGSPFGTLNCKTGNGSDIGRLTGKTSGNAVVDINAILSCGFLVPSAKWTGTYAITGPSGLGVVA